MARGFSIVRRLTVLVTGFCLLVTVLNLMLLPAVFGPVLADHLFAQARQGALVQRLARVTPAAQREALFDELVRLGFQVSTEQPLPPSAQAPRHPPELMDRATELLAPGQAMAYAARAEPGAGLAMSTRVLLPDGQSWWVTQVGSELPASPMLSPMATACAGILLVGGVGVAVAVFSVRLFTRPMAELARHLLDRRDAMRTVQAPRHASVELHQVIDAFNQMVQALQAQEAQRRQLMAGLSHDLRTPLSRLRLRAECLLPATDLRPMEADFEVLDRIIGQFVAFSHLGANPHPVGRPLPLGEVLERLAARYAGAQGLSFLPLPALTVGWRYPDLALVRLLVNLIDNALEHGRLPVQLLAEAADDDGLWLWVRDSGPGVGHLARRLSSDALDSLDAGRVGGLGLKIADQIARQLGSKLQAQPRDGAWSAVGLHLPRPAA